MNKKVTSVVVGKHFKDQEGKIVMEKIVIHEIKFIKGIIKSDLKFILKGKKGAVVIGDKSRETKTERSKVQGINLLTGERTFISRRQKMKTQILTIFFLIIALMFAPLCSADVGDVIFAPAKVVEGLLWVPAIALVVSVGVPMYFLMKLDESIKGKETKNVS